MNTPSALRRATPLSLVVAKAPARAPQTPAVVPIRKDMAVLRVVEEWSDFLEVACQRRVGRTVSLLLQQAVKLLECIIRA
ncbi:MAG: hypothetical protein SGARI_007613, partial [Bacillariaceae sp.]